MLTGQKRPVLIMVADEGRFGRLADVKACWCPQNVRPVVSKQQIRQYTYAYAAVAPSIVKMTSLILPYSNTQMMNLFLKQVAQDFSEYSIIMQLDRAGWHRSNSSIIPENIHLIFQPPYSPELMPIEHLWDYIRENYFYNQIFNSMIQVMDTLEKALFDLSENSKLLHSLTNFSHLRIRSLNAT